MNNFYFSKRSKNNLEGVHPDLIVVVTYALVISKIDFAIIDGIRTVEEQRRLIEEGASWTMKSRHLTGHAIDVMAYVRGRGSWVRAYYPPIADAMMKASQRFHIPIFWGGNWESYDAGHFHLTWDAYPGDTNASS